MGIINWVFNIKSIKTMRTKLFWLGALLFAITLNSCVKKTFNAEVVIPATDTLNITASVYGRIIDEAGIPVAGATVKSPTANTTTNINGEFSFSDIPLNDYAAYVTASHSGYFSGARTFIARQGQSHYIEIQLMKKNVVGILNSVTGGTINLTSGVSLNLPSNAVKNEATGTKYTGDIHVAITWIDPTNTNGGRKIPGALRGFNAKNLEMGLESYGMIGVSLTGNNGEALQLDTNKNATLTFPINTTIQQNAPASKIDLWSFDETTGFWKQEGTAVRSGSNFVASVSHFSFWNCDAPYAGVRFSVTVRDTKNSPLKQTLVRIKRVYTNTYGYGFTDTSGVVSGLVPTNEPLVVEVMGTGSCAQTILFSGNVGPYSSTTADAGVVYVNNTGSYGTAVIAGKAVNCSGVGISSGFIYFNLRGLSYQTAITNGNYSVSIPMCTSSDTISYYVLNMSDNTIGRWNNAVVYTGTNNFSPIKVCNSGTSVPYQRFIYYYIDSVSTASVDSLTSAPDSTSGYAVTNVLPSFTSIYGYRNASNNISFTFPGINNGSYNIDNLYINFPYLKVNTITKTNVSVNVTNYSSAIGGFISGSFSGTFFSDTLHVINGVFQVRRDY